MMSSTHASAAFAPQDKTTDHRMAAPTSSTPAGSPMARWSAAAAAPASTNATATGATAKTAPPTNAAPKAAWSLVAASHGGPPRNLRIETGPGGTRGGPMPPLELPPRSPQAMYGPPRPCACRECMGVPGGWSHAAHGVYSMGYAAHTMQAPGPRSPIMSPMPSPRMAQGAGHDPRRPHTGPSGCTCCECIGCPEAHHGPPPLQQQQQQQSSSGSASAAAGGTSASASATTTTAGPLPSAGAGAGAGAGAAATSGAGKELSRSLARARSTSLSVDIPTSPVGPGPASAPASHGYSAAGPYAAWGRSPRGPVPVSPMMGPMSPAMSPYNRHAELRGRWVGFGDPGRRVVPPRSPGFDMLAAAAQQIESRARSASYGDEQRARRRSRDEADLDDDIDYGSDDEDSDSGSDSDGGGGSRGSGSGSDVDLENPHARRRGALESSDEEAEEDRAGGHDDDDDDEDDEPAPVKLPIRTSSSGRPLRPSRVSIMGPRGGKTRKLSDGSASSGRVPSAAEIAAAARKPRSMSMSSVGSRGSAGSGAGGKKYVGVYRHHSGRWEAKIGHGRKRQYLGMFGTADEAAEAYDKAAVAIGRPAKNGFTVAKPKKGKKGKGKVKPGSTGAGAGAGAGAVGASPSGVRVTLRLGTPRQRSTSISSIPEHGEEGDDEHTSDELGAFSDGAESGGEHAAGEFVGVTRRSSGKWEAHIWSQGRSQSLGRFSHAKSAALAYDDAAVGLGRRPRNGFR